MGRTLRNRKRRKKEQKVITEEPRQTDVGLYVQLMRWMVNNGFTGSYLQPAHFQDAGRGLKATANIQPGDTILCIPSKLLITTTTVLNSELGPLIRRHSVCLTPQQILAVFLLFECWKGASSFWSPYIALLPRSFSTPAFFLPKELQLLPKCMYILAKAQIECVTTAFEELHNFFEVLKKIYPSVSSMLSYNRFCWAWFAVNTRCVFMEQKNRQDNCVMAPYIDLLNHSPRTQTVAGFDTSLDCYVIKTGKGYRKWQQAFICYGPHGNDKLFLEYGFVVPNNHHSSLQFDIDEIVSCLDDRLTAPNSILIRRKLQILEESNLQCNLTCGWDGLSWRLVTALKIMCMDSKEIESWKMVYSSETISTHCENRVNELAARLLTTQLRENQAIMQEIADTAGPSTKLPGHLYLIQQLREERTNMLKISMEDFISDNSLTILQ